MIVGPDVNHSGHVTPVAGGTERGQYTSGRVGDTTGGDRGLCDGLLTVRDGHLCLDGVDLVAPPPARDAVLRVQRAPSARQRAGAARRLRRPAPGAPRSSSPARRVPISGSCTWCATPGISVEVNSGGELERRCARASRRGRSCSTASPRREPRSRAPWRSACAPSSWTRSTSWSASPRWPPLGNGGRGAAHRRARAALTHPGLETAFGGKAGIDRDDAVEAFRRAAADPWLEPVGLHLHVGSQITSVEPYRQAVETALDLVAEVEAAGRRAPALPRRRRRVRRARTASRSRRRAVRRRRSRRLLRLGARRRRLCRRDLRRLRRGGPTSRCSSSPAARSPTTPGVLVTRVESEKTKGVRDAGGRGDRRGALAHHRRRLQHAARAHQLRAGTSAARGRPGRRAGRHAVPARRPALRRRRRVRRRRRHAVSPVPGRTRRRRPRRLPRRRRLHARDDERLQCPAARGRVRRDLGGEVVEIRRRETEPTSAARPARPAFDA